MTDETVIKEKEKIEKDSTQKSESSKPAGASTGPQAVGAPQTPASSDSRSKRPFKKNVRKSRRKERTKSEFDSKIVSIRRVTRVVAGGRRFSFSVSLVAGDKNGSVGVGTGKANDTTLAIEKAMKSAQKSMVTFSLTPEKSIPFDVRSKFTSSDIIIFPAPGRGLSAGSSARTVLELAGITDVTTKIFSRSKNQLNNARATLAALKKLGYKKYKKAKAKTGRDDSRNRKPVASRGAR